MSKDFSHEICASIVAAASYWRRAHHENKVKGGGDAIDAKAQPVMNTAVTLV